MLSNQLKRDDGDQSYIISKKFNNLSSISNLTPNTFYNISFNDLSLSFISDNNGIIYMNKQKELLSLECMSCDLIRISPGYHHKVKFTKNPIGNYTNQSKNTWPCKSTTLYLDLAEFNAITQKTKLVTRKILIKRGTVQLLPPRSYIKEVYKSIFSL